MNTVLVLWWKSYCWFQVNFAMSICFGRQYLIEPFKPLFRFTMFLNLFLARVDLNPSSYSSLNVINRPK